MESLPDIIQNCLAGDTNAQELLYNKYSGKMYGVCLRYSNNYDDAKDILQEGFIKVFTNLHQFKGKGSFEGWIRRIMVNTALEKYRDKHYLNRVDEEDAEKLEKVDYNVIDEMSARDLMKVIQELSPKYRMVFNLFAIEGYSHREISVLLEISEGTSKSNLSRARAILQEKLADYNGKIRNQVG